MSSVLAPISGPRGPITTASPPAQGGASAPPRATTGGPTPPDSRPPRATSPRDHPALPRALPQIGDVPMHPVRTARIREFGKRQARGRENVAEAKARLRVAECAADEERLGRAVDEAEEYVEEVGLCLKRAEEFLAESQARVKAARAADKIWHKEKNARVAERRAQQAAKRSVAAEKEREAREAEGAEKAREVQERAKRATEEGGRGGRPRRRRQTRRGGGWTALGGQAVATGPAAIQQQIEETLRWVKEMRRLGRRVTAEEEAQLQKVDGRVKEWKAELHRALA
ncbi:hypothetical protein N0V88_008015 [Collariella sp. IMI 366227]|nr:hypothetical protein N0V88_008015 [Collariella sp. IMI 366227]